MTTPKVEADLQGSLRVFMLSDIMQLLSLSQQSGTLTLTQGWNARTIGWRKGRICRIAVASGLTKLGDLLLRAGKIDANVLRRALQSQNDHPERLGEILLRWKAITKDDLQQALDQQLEETIYSLFLWRNGRFTFVEGDADDSDGIPVDLGSERLIMEGSRRVDEWIRISPMVPSMRLVYRRTNQHVSDTISAEARNVLTYVDDHSDAVAIARNGGLTQFDTALLLAELATAKLIEAMPPDRMKIVALFNLLVETLYIKVTMFGYPAIAREFQEQLNVFAQAHGLKVRMVGGKVQLSDADVRIETTALIDIYKLFVGVEMNKFSKIFPSDVYQGLLQGLYQHSDEDFRLLMRMYDFYAIEGLLR